MTRLSSAIEIAVPAATCIRAVQETMTDARLLREFKALRSGKEYSGAVSMLVPERRMVIAFAGLEPSTNKRSHAFGWNVTYDFTALGDGMTRVEVSVEYGLLTAVMAAGLAKPQAENEISHRLAALRMLEFGLQQGSGAAV